MLSSIKPDERPKVIALAGAVAAVFVVGGINILRQTAGVGAPAASLPSASADATPSSAPTPTASGSGSPAGMDGAMYVARPHVPVDMLAILHPNFGADPFRPIVTVKTIPIVGPNVSPSAPGPVITQVPTLPSFSSAFGRPTAAATPTPAPPPTLRLTGVVAGPDAIAMISVGGGQRFLHMGDTIQGYRVAHIDEDVVTLRRGNAGKVLRVGSDNSEAVAFLPDGSTNKQTSETAEPPAAAAHLFDGTTPLDLLISLLGADPGPVKVPQSVAAKSAGAPSKSKLTEDHHLAVLAAAVTPLTSSKKTLRSSSASTSRSETKGH